MRRVLLVIPLLFSCAVHTVRENESTIGSLEALHGATLWGNGVLKPGTGEECNGGNFLSGDGCSEIGQPEHPLSGSVCGNGVREDPEACDGADLGGQTCQSQGFDNGTITCSASCNFDTSGCSNNPTPPPSGTLPQWVEYPDSMFADHIDCNSLPDCKPNSVLNAWSSMVLDMANNCLISFGGGHADSHYNGINQFCLDTGQWEELLKYQTDIPDPTVCNDTDANGNPVSRHTYGGLVYIPQAGSRTTDYLWLHGGSEACYSGKFGRDTWEFNLRTKSWERVGVDMPNSPNGPYLYCTYDSVADKVDCVFWSSGWYSLDSFDPETKTWSYILPLYTSGSTTSLGGGLDDGSNPVIVHSPGSMWDNHLVMLSSSHPNKILSVDLSNPAFEFLDLTGDSAGITSSETGVGLDWAGERLVAWTAVSSAVAPTSVFEIWDTTVIERQNGSGPVLHDADNSGRWILGKWRYSAASNAIVGVYDANENVWKYDLGIIPLDGGCPPADVVLSDQSSPTAFKDALARISSGGTIVVKPGIYYLAHDDIPFLSGRGDTTICGEGTAEIRGDPAALPNALVYWAPSSHDLILKNLSFADSGGDCIAAGSGDDTTPQHIVLDGVRVHGCGSHGLLVGYEHNTAEAFGQSNLQDEVTIRDSEFWSCTSHNVYIDRIKSADISRLKSYLPGNAHALKIVAANFTLLDSTISNSSLAGDVDTEGAASVDLTSGSSGIVRGNTIIFRGTASYSGPAAMQRSDRCAIGGSDDPPYKVRTSDMWDRFWWNRVNPANFPDQYTLNVFYSANTFVLANGGLLQNPIGIANFGTYPCVPGAETPDDLPKGWLERSRDYLYEGAEPGEGNVWVGTWSYKAKNRELRNLMGLNPGDRFVIVTDTPIPTWFRR